MKMRIVVITLLLLPFVLIACGSSNSSPGKYHDFFPSKSTGEEFSKTSNVTWMTINSPPGEMSRCYAYFVGRSFIGGFQYAGSDAVCGTDSLSAARPEEVQFEVLWVPIDPPPGEDGPCYGYFREENNIFGYASLFSATWCTDNK